MFMFTIEIKGRKHCIMGTYQLKNKELTLTVISAGAEMKSLKDTKTRQEYLWQADRNFGEEHHRFFFQL